MTGIEQDDAAGQQEKEDAVDDGVIGAICILHRERILRHVVAIFLYCGFVAAEGICGLAKYLYYGDPPLISGIAWQSPRFHL